MTITPMTKEAAQDPLMALLSRIAKHERELTPEEWAADNIKIFRDTIDEAYAHLLAQLSICAQCNGMAGQEADDFIANHIGTVSDIDPLQQSNFPALIKAALVAEHKKG